MLKRNATKIWGSSHWSLGNEKMLIFVWISMEPSIRVRSTLQWKYRDANGSLYSGMMMCIVAEIQPPKRLASGQKKRIFKTLMLETEKIVCRLKTKEFLWEVFLSKCKTTKLDSCVKVSGNWNLSTSSKTRKAPEWTKATHSLST